jgi:hypothetical protein
MTDSGVAREKIYGVSQWLKRLGGVRQATMAGFLEDQLIGEITGYACCVAVVVLKYMSLVRPICFVCNPLSAQNKNR